MSPSRIFDSIAASLPDNPKETKQGFWVSKTDNEIMCPDKSSANMLADLLEEIGCRVCIHYYHPLEETGNKDCIGWYSVYM